MDPLRRLASHAKPYLLPLAAATAMMVVVAAASGAKAYLVKPVFDDIFVRKDLRMLKLLPLLIVGVYLVSGLCQAGAQVLILLAAQGMVRDVRNALYRHLLDLPISFFAGNASGNVLSSIINDVDQLRLALTRTFSSLLKDALTVCCLLAVVFTLNAVLTLVALLFVPLGVLLIWTFSRRIRRAGRSAQDLLAGLTHRVLETFSGIRIVKAFGMEAHEEGCFRRENQRLFRTHLRIGLLQAVSPQVMEMLAILGTAAIIAYGGWQVILGISSPGTFFSFIAALFMLYLPLNNLTNVNTQIQTALGAADRIFTLLDEAPEPQEWEGAAVLAVLSRSIRFEDVSFRYGDTPVLESIDVTVNAGEIVAVVGASGAGKTTLLGLLPRFYDVSGGRILIDGTDIRGVTLASLRSLISIVTQHVILFDDTVRNNIACGDRRASDPAIREAAEKAGAHAFVRSLPRGYDTRVGERGVRLSGGQGQRIAIARAFLKNAPILILDEATSSLDARTEQEVHNAFRHLMAGRTAFVVAHRLSTVKDADRILVLAGGRIVEQGKHGVLMARQGEYFRLYSKQRAEEA